jgi:hypothetical protein
MNKPRMTRWLNVSKKLINVSIQSTDCMTIIPCILQGRISQHKLFKLPSKGLIVLNRRLQVQRVVLQILLNVIHFGFAAVAHPALQQLDLLDEAFVGAP